MEVRGRLRFKNGEELGGLGVGAEASDGGEWKKLGMVPAGGIPGEEGRMGNEAGGSWGHPPGDRAPAHSARPVFCAQLCIWALGAQQGIEQT